MRALRRIGLAAVAVVAMGVMLAVGAARFASPKAVPGPGSPTCIAIEGNYDYAAGKAKSQALFTLLENREDAALAANGCDPEMTTTSTGG